MLRDKRMQLCTLAVAMCALILAAPLGAADRARVGSGDLLKDPQRGLTWIADGDYAIRSGLVDRLVLPRAEALEALA
ncbi:MAG: hypothetical protein KDD11_05180, partial [Acidobacteria bacterium]|nr:hypothetical protein [Acidobacteriota bacterium]